MASQVLHKPLLLSDSCQRHSHNVIQQCSPLQQDTPSSLPFFLLVQHLQKLVLPRMSLAAFSCHWALAFGLAAHVGAGALQASAQAPAPHRLQGLVLSSQSL